ncbi:hypothetical protein HPB50_014760 [Hyalomma asiaticum]|uniref:Uncharacterized protein n=1 Tax=Hyalomma asiaticum TaxID=266040 RepID=A0ACB7TIG4_HYAAI|nr:hypothetical protein HPB50_014760 [Hyalomma asiaticum]
MHLILGGQHHEPFENVATAPYVATLFSAWSGSFCMGVSLGYVSPAASSLATSNSELAESLRNLASSVWDAAGKSNAHVHGAFTPSAALPVSINAAGPDYSREPEKPRHYSYNYEPRSDSVKRSPSDITAWQGPTDRLQQRVTRGAPVCFYCGVRGHIARFCSERHRDTLPQYERPPAPLRRQSAGAGTFACQSMGRRFTLLMSALAYISGYSVMFAATSGLLFLVGHFLTGVATGAVSLSVPAYVTEVTLPRHRGTMGGIMQLFTAAGILYSYALGAFFEWELLAMACFMGAIMLLAASQFSVESPRWLLLKGRKLEALQALVQLRGIGTRVDNECQAIDQLFASLPTPALNILLAFHVHLLQQCSGITMIILYAHSVFAAPGAAVNATSTAIIIASIQVTATLCTVSVMAVVGRRRLMAISSMVCVFSICQPIKEICHMKKPGSFQASKGQPLFENRALKPKVISYSPCYSVGLGPVVWTLGAELVPCRESGFYLGAATALNWTSALIVTLLSHALVESSHFSAMVWLFGFITFVGAMLTSMFLPETRGQTLEQILLGPFYEHHQELMSRRSQFGKSR